MSANRKTSLCVQILIVLHATTTWALTPFATEVVDYRPAPGQWVNDESLNDPTSALGRPYAGGSDSPDHSSLVTLGGFGGFISLRFDHMVEDDPLNPFGLDAIVFGNAFWVGDDPNRHWAECAIIEIALDENENGEIDADEGWYLIPGSHILDPVAQYAARTWDDDPDTTVPPDYLSWIPPERSGTWSTSTYELPPDIFGQMIIVNPSAAPDMEGIYGYAEYSPTLILGDTDGDNLVDDPMIAPELFYTVPDDPLTIGVSPGSGGGDAFDIAWAIDPDSGLPANLPGFDFIRITNPTDAVLPIFMEKSPEIDAVADVAPDPLGDCDGDDDIDLADVACLQTCFSQPCAERLACDRMDSDGDEFVDDFDSAAFVGRLTGPR